VRFGTHGHEPEAGAKTIAGWRAFSLTDPRLCEAASDAFDPVVTAGSILTVAVVSVLAGVVPARRAVRLDPIRALRHE
jgi:hypothetical protein